MCAGAYEKNNRIHADGHSKAQGNLRDAQGGILGGRYSATRKLPSEVQLMRRFGTSRVTVIHTLQELRERGLIVRPKGSGSFLATDVRGFGRSISLAIPISRSEIFPPICREVTRLAQQDGYAILLADFMTVPSEQRVAEA